MFTWQICLTATLIKHMAAMKESLRHLVSWEHSIIPW